ncbi:MAG: HD domain-containing protein [Bacteroidia bacterium]
MLPIDKIVNDPVHGFIEIPQGQIKALLQHPWVQRLRRISQLGMAYYVYPGATHTRFLHALGAMHLGAQTLQHLIRKNIPITAQEYQATLAALLLHDIGHGPFSHTLEGILLPHTHHEEVSRQILRALNYEMKGALDLTLAIFEGTYPKPFLHQLVHSQLDMDRMDYLIRDSFFTGVQEGIVGIDRIIKTLTVHEGRLVVEEKGLYSVEKFLIARRLMYWQVYLHKTVLAAEKMLIQFFRRLHDQGIQLGISQLDLLLRQPSWENLMQVDDADILHALHVATGHSDAVLQTLARSLRNRHLFKLHLAPSEKEKEQYRLYKLRLAALWGEKHIYFTQEGEVTNYAYERRAEPIQILYKDGSLREVTEASDLENLSTLIQPVKKSFVAYFTSEVSWREG